MPYSHTHYKVTAILTLAVLCRAPDLYRVSPSSDGSLLTLTLQGTLPSGIWSNVMAFGNVISALLGEGGPLLNKERGGD